MGISYGFKMQQPRVIYTLGDDTPETLQVGRAACQLPYKFGRLVTVITVYALYMYLDSGLLPTIHKYLREIVN